MPYRIQWLSFITFILQRFVQPKNMNKRAAEHLQAYPMEITIFNTEKQMNNKLEAPVTVGFVIASAFPAWKVALATLEVQEHLLASGHRHLELHPGELLLQLSLENNSHLGIFFVCLLFFVCLGFFVVLVLGFFVWFFVVLAFFPLNLVRKEDLIDLGKPAMGY